MLRSFVILLIVLNVLLFGWGQGWMPWLGTLPQDAGRDTRRVERQQFAERLVLVPPAGGNATVVAAASVPVAPTRPTAAASAATPSAAETASASAPAALAGASAPSETGLPATVAAALASAPAREVSPAPVAAVTSPPATAGAASMALPGVLASASASAEPVCLEMAYFTAAEAKEVEPTLTRALKRADWTLQSVAQPATWLVYMGPYEQPDEADRKATELRRMNVAFEEVRSPAALLPGLSLGRFADAAKAADRLAEAQRKGVRSARVVEAAPGRNVFVLRLPRADARVQGQLVEVLPQLKGRRLRPCAAS